ncbi:basic amino acid ABC transporter substrate-binding protein [Negativicoccus succinicivorans]|uniref:basic amino acid ABC transporter substrate-binding protein n=1 Tax=Negativicoccus succinicivorans TaxID=620903 RepID=UPI002903AEE6|nr:basic amino acid ABC transporter substrate-binding protein [Negativicoccus succinicivorans]MDU2417373.1 basic amino acid ABC transporter substrate-binding protein [Negativicoccus succinicivorans]
MKQWWKWMVLCIAVLAVAGCGGTKSDAPQSTTWKVGTNATFVPFEYTDDSHQLNGFDIELFNAIAKKAGMQVEYKNISFDGSIPALGTKQIDAVISGMTITKARTEKVDFSFPYYQSGLGVLTKDGTAVADLSELSGKKVAVQLGTTGAEKASEISNIELRTFDNNSESLLELTKGGVDAVIADLPVLQYYLTTKKDSVAKLSVIESKEPEYFGIAVKKGNKEVKDKINAALQELKKDGTLDALYQKYFNQDAPVMPEK